MAMAAAAATTRRLTGGLLGGGDSKICSLSSLIWVRRMVEQPESAKVPSEDEMKAFAAQFNVFLKRCHTSVPEGAFAELMKSLSSSMSTIAHKDGVLYSAELGNLVATFVPVQGTYVPYNSKVVAVDMMRRINALEASKPVVGNLAKRVASMENGKELQNVLISGVVAAFLGSMFYMPFSIYKLEREVQELEGRLSALGASHSVEDTPTKEENPSNSSQEDKAPAVLSAQPPTMPSAEGKKATSAPAKDAKSNVCAVLSAQSPSMPSAEGKKAASTPAKDAKSNIWNMEITSTILGAMGGCAIAGILMCILTK